MQFHIQKHAQKKPRPSKDETYSRGTTFVASSVWTPTETTQCR